MVEMTEAANILHNATRAEPGADGRDRPRHVDLRRPVARLGDRARAGREEPRLTLFATHYFELTALPAEIDGCANVHLDAVTEHGDGIVFLHAVADGPANRELRPAGREARRRAGGDDPPRARLSRAPRAVRRGGGRQGDLFAPAPPPGGEAADAAPPAPDALAAALAAIDPDALTPRDALAALYDLKKLARE